MLLENYSLVKLSRNSNEWFLRKQFISVKRTSHNFLVKCAYVGFNEVFPAKMKSVQKGSALHELTFFVR